MCAWLLSFCNFTPYPRGMYRDAAGAGYRLSAGPAALSLQGPNGLCLMFWDEENAPSNRKVIDLHGKSCGDGSFEDFTWKARYAPDRLQNIQLISIAPADRAIDLVRQPSR